MSPEDLFSNYLRHIEINNYLDSLAASFPEFVTVTVCGQSYEGRAIKSVKISYKNVNYEKNDESVGNSKTNNSISFKSRSASAVQKIRKKLKSKKGIIKPSILIDGGIHGREWMSVATALYCIRELIENFEKYRKLLEKLDFIIVPIINVDGYEYSHTNVGKIYCFNYYNAM